jgi:glycosyltransferase involved in cell wall biosynthesis
MEVLRQLSRERDSSIEVVLFGCSSGDSQFRELPLDYPWRNVGVLNGYQMAAFLNEVDVFVDYSDWQAMGATAMEAMACGVAVAVPERGGSSTFVSPEETGLLIDTSSVEACLAATRRLVSDHDLRLAIQGRSIRAMCKYYPESGALRTLTAVFGGPGHPDVARSATQAQPAHRTAEASLRQQ